MTAQTNSIANDVAGAVMEVIRTRRTVREFSPQPVPRELIDQIVEAATWAPNHRHTEPWRFIVLEKDGEARKKVADAVYEWTWNNIKNPNPANRERSSADARDEVLLTPVLMLIYAIPGSNEEITEENFSATCCAAQNMQLMAHALGLAVGWSTGRLCKAEEVHQALGVNPDWAVVGAFFIGFPKALPEAERQPLSDVCTYLG